MSKETRLVARLKAITALSALVSTRVYPLTAPSGATLPLVLYELLTDRPYNDSTGTTKSRMAQFRVMPMAAASDSNAGYDAMVEVADAIIGDEARTSTTGLSGWIDADGSVWHLDDQSDDMAQLLSGQDVLECYARDMTFSVQYSR